MLGLSDLNRQVLDKLLGSHPVRRPETPISADNYDRVQLSNITASGTSAANS
jgi:hypothetical protein